MLDQDRLFSRFACVVFLLSLSLGIASTFAEDQKAAARKQSLSDFDQTIKPLLKKHCFTCHGLEMPEGELSLSALDPDMESTSAARWAMVLDQVVMGKMPPEGETPLSKEHVQTLVGWIKAEMKRTGKHLARRAEYHNGNKVPHELLFDPKHAGTIDVPTRVRRLSPAIYEGLVQDVTKNANGVSQPFSPDANTTFQDMGAPPIDEPTTQTLLRNALRIVAEQTNHKLENGKAVKVGFTQKEFLRLFDTQNPATDEEVKKALQIQCEKVLKRKPTASESEKFLTLYQKNIKDAGRETGVRYTLAAFYLLPEAVFRWEVGTDAVDQEGRVRLAPREIAFALAFALTDKRPENWLLAQADKGGLDTKEGVADAVRKMLQDPKLKRTRILRFFQEYFQYDQAVDVFKEKKENNDHDAKNLVADTDRLVQSILENDKQVLYELLTTNKSFVAYNIAEDTKKKRAQAIADFEKKKKKEPEKYKDKTVKLPGRSVYESYNLTDFPDKQPVELPANQRAGILTQPSWLVAWSKSDENDAIHRGKWIRERLLGGVVPDIPITVDAQLPNAPEKTLRERMAVTTQEYCWNCHTYMNRVGLPFEMFDHYGRFRDEELVLDREATKKNLNNKGEPQGQVLHGIPVDAGGGLEHTGDPKLQGDVSNAVELMHRLAKSEKVEQVFIRHAFRYWMGRNETLGDAATLQAAHRDYQQSEGSMNALIVSLLTSDSFLYRIKTTAKSETRNPNHTK